ncbi:MAG: putative glycosyl hydrolase [Pedosphaera sp.]|nr:putative glycosyl hydrolase [Pedosphaera sp.]
MFRFAITLLLSCLLGTSAFAAPLERWVYVQINLLTPAEAERLETLMRRARPLGFTHFMLADSKFTHIPQMGVPYAENIKRVKKAAAELGIELVPAVFPVGYSNDLLWHDPNLAEGLPVRDALFVVTNGVAQVVADPPVAFPPLAERKRWGFVDDSFQPDENGLRVTDVKDANARIMTRVVVAPFRQYHVSVRVKTRDFHGQPEIKALVGGDRSLSYTKLKSKPTQDWQTEHITFNSLEQTNVNIYLGVWGANGGSLWLADPCIEEAGPVNLLRRDGCPLHVRIEGGRELKEGVDFESLRDPRLGNQPWAGEYEVWHDAPPLKAKLPDGTRLRVSYFHPHIVYDEQVCACPSEPKFDQLLEAQARDVHAAWGTTSYMMSHDEWRVLGWDEACRRRNLDAGALVADNTSKCVNWLRAVHPHGRILAWSDMFDPFHNAVKNYYLVRGDLTGAWNGLDKSVIVMNWNFDHRRDSLKFFSDRGQQQILAGYYDAGAGQIGQWLEATRGVPGVIGVMYTTWERNFTDLEAFAGVVDKFEKN